MTYRNFAARALPDLRHYAKLARAHGWTLTADSIDMVIHRIEAAEHFALPEGGQLLADGLKGLVNEDIKLPFEMMTVECSWVNPADRHKRRDALAVVQAPQHLFMTHAPNAQFSVCVVAFNRKTQMWILQPLFAAVMAVLPDSGGSRVQVEAFQLLPEAYEDYIMTKAYGDDKEAAHESMQWNVHHETFAVLELLEALSCSNVKTQRIQQATPEENARRIRRHKRPLLAYRELVLRTSAQDSPLVPRGGPSDRAPVRQHLRRGHIRRYESGLKLWINQMIVGDPTRGTVNKHYVVKP